MGSMPGRLRAAVTATVLASLAVLAAAGGAAAAPRAAALPRAVAGDAAQVPGWRLQSTVTIAGQDVALTSVVAVAKDDAWALGDYGLASSDFLRRWNGTRWASVAMPATVEAVLAANSGGVVAASSGSDVWVLGSVNWLHFDGTTWQDGLLPPGLTNVDAALVLAPDDVWVFGGSNQHELYNIPYVARFYGSRWTQTPVPDAAEPYAEVLAASAVSATDIWAVIANLGPYPLTDPGNVVIRWQGRGWRQQALPASFANRFNPYAILAASPSGVWVGGIVPAGKTGTASGVAHWNGRRWTVTQLGPASATQPVPTSIVSDGGGGLWALSGQQYPWKFWHEAAETATARWVSVAPRLPAVPAQLARVPGGTSVWAVGTCATAAANGTCPGTILLYGAVPR